MSVPKRPLKGIENAVASGRDRRFCSQAGTAQQVDEGEELLRVLGAEEIDKGPGLGVQVTVVAVTKTGVSDQALEPEWALEAPPVG